MKHLSPEWYALMSARAAETDDSSVAASRPTGEPVASSVALHHAATLRYLREKQCNVRAGCKKEIGWAESLRLADVSESEFLSEVLFVALSSGMRAEVVRKVWPFVHECFDHFPNSACVVQRQDRYVKAAQAHYNHPGKLRSVVVAAQRIEDAGMWGAFRARQLLVDPGKAIDGIPYIGKITRWHLLRNLGADVAKPDRHLVRLVEALGYPSAQALCEAVSKASGDRVGVVDLVFWRHAERGCACATKEKE